MDVLQNWCMLREIINRSSASHSRIILTKQSKQLNFKDRISKIEILKRKILQNISRTQVYI